MDAQIVQYILVYAIFKVPLFQRWFMECILYRISVTIYEHVDSLELCVNG